MKILSTPKTIAKALNFGKYPVLTYNIDTQEGSKCVVIHKSGRYGDMRYQCKLGKDYEVEGDNILYISTNSTCIKGDYDWSDYLEDAEYAQAPVIEPDQEVAVYIYSPKAKIGIVRIVKSGKIDVHCQVATMLKDVEEDK